MFTSFQDLGLPDGHAFPKLAYHEPTGTVIASSRPTKAGMPRNRLSFRRVDDSRYHPIGDFSDATSIDSVVLDPLRPALYFMTTVWRELEGSAWGGDWDGLHRFDLELHQCERLATRGDLRGDQSDGAAWLTDLLSVTGDGRSLICRAAMHCPGLGYWIARLDLSHLTLTGITKLKAVFV